VEAGQISIASFGALNSGLRPAARADRLAQAMAPHLFNDAHPPAVQVAALGDLGGAIGAALLVAGG